LVPHGVPRLARRPWRPAPTRAQTCRLSNTSGRAKLSGVETELTYAVVYTIRNGKVARGREYWTKDQALEVAGLRE
jgi:ketosteroid isomerase-like protein